MESLVFPDYDSNIVNLMGSVQKAFGAEPPHAPLADLDPRSLAERSAVVVLVLDGLGAEFLAAHATHAPFLSAHQQRAITTVYPSTTAAAVTSLMSGMTPLEHGALGWSLFFKELGRYVDFLPFRDSVDGEHLGRAEHEMGRILRVSNVFSRIAAQGAETFYFASRMIVRDEFADESSEPARRVGSLRSEVTFRRLTRLLRSRHRGGLPRFAFCYCAEPDHTVHRKGTSAPETAEVVRRLDSLVERMSRRLSGAGVTIIVTADHGLIDTPTDYWLDQDPAVYGSLILAPFPEKRFVSFHVKAARRAGFPELMARYGGDFQLMSREELLERGLLGRGTQHPKVDDFLGDYVALATGTAQMHTRIVKPGEKKWRFPAHHAGLTRQEMLVPLIRIDT